MSLRIDEQDEITIKATIDIFEVISHFEPLKKQGKNYVCKCLFHNENTASFTVSRAKGIYKCYGCGVGGDGLKFIQEYLKLSYVDALRWFADFYNIPLVAPDTTPRPYSRPVPRPALEQPPITPVTYIPKDVFNCSLGSYGHNNFVTFLHTLFDKSVVTCLIEKYYIGTSKHYTGAVVFWQLDENENIRYGKVMGYNPETGKRIREPYQQINTICGAILKKHLNAQTAPPQWVAIYEQQDPKPQCLFGLHLINEDLVKPIAIVESEKTAIVASVFIPEFIWLAAGAKGYEKYNKQTGNINQVPETFRDKFKPLAGRNVVLFPDLGAGEDWQHLAVELSHVTNVSVNNLLKDAAREYHLPDKADLCDYLTSEAARRELKENLKDALIKNTDDTDAGQYQIWIYYRERGLRYEDWLIACDELIKEGYFIENKELQPA